MSAEKEGDGDDLGDVSEDDEAAEMVIHGATDDGMKEMVAKKREKQKEKEKVWLLILLSLQLLTTSWRNLSLTNW